MNNEKRKKKKKTNEKTFSDYKKNKNKTYE